MKQEEEYKNKLSEAQYKVLREKATESACSGKDNLHFEAGNYTCGACSTPLFSSTGNYETSSSTIKKPSLPFF